MIQDLHILTVFIAGLQLRRLLVPDGASATFTRHVLLAYEVAEIWGKQFYQPAKLKVYTCLHSAAFDTSEKLQEYYLRILLSPIYMVFYLSESS